MVVDDQQIRRSTIPPVSSSTSSSIVNIHHVITRSTRARSISSTHHSLYTRTINFINSSLALHAHDQFHQLRPLAAVESTFPNRTFVTLHQSCYQPLSTCHESLQASAAELVATLPVGISPRNAPRRSLLSDRQTLSHVFHNFHSRSVGCSRHTPNQRGRKVSLDPSSQRLLSQLPEHLRSRGHKHTYEGQESKKLGLSYGSCSRS